MTRRDAHIMARRLRRWGWEIEVTYDRRYGWDLDGDRGRHWFYGIRFGRLRSTRALCDLYGP